MPDVTFTVDGKKITAPAGTLLIEACKNCRHRHPGVLLLPRALSLQAACRMCVVRIEKDAQAADRVHHAGGRRHDRGHRNT